jgi:phospholipid/cholesterol/gamma-HCH transport system substrate-binding protein
MSNNIAEAVIGAVVVASAVVFALYAGRTSGSGVGRDSYSLLANFRSVEGISLGTDVRLAGIKVGSVTGLELDPDDYQVKANFTVRKDLHIPDDSDVKIGSEGLLGGSFLELTPGASEYMLEPGDEVVNTQSSVSLLNLLMKFGSGK